MAMSMLTVVRADQLLQYQQVVCIRDGQLVVGRISSISIDTHGDNVFMYVVNPETGDASSESVRLSTLVPTFSY